MRIRNRKYEDISPVDFLLLRENLGLGRYRKQRERDPEEKRILIDLALKKMKEKEEDDYLPIENKKRRLKI